MDAEIVKSLETFVDRASALLRGGISSAYCFGSAVYDDFRAGYSDLDFFLITGAAISQEDFDRLSALRAEYKRAGHPHFSVLEGEVVCRDAIKNDAESNVIYWGTSQDRLKRKYGLAGFSLRGLLDKGYRIAGDDLRSEIPYPSDDEMLSQVDSLIATIRKHGQTTTEDIHSADWLFLVSQSVYWLETGSTDGKTSAARWVLQNRDESWADALQKAVGLRLDPVRAKSGENRRWLGSLGPVVQSACDSLVALRAAGMPENCKK